MRLGLVLSALAAAGCLSSAEAEKPKRAQRQQAAAEVELAKTPVPRTYRYTDGELRVIEAPVKDASGFVDVQRCFVWRDHEFKTATISCGQMPEVLLSGSN